MIILYNLRTLFIQELLLAEELRDCTPSQVLRHIQQLLNLESVAIITLVTANCICLACMVITELSAESLSLFNWLITWRRPA